MENKGFLKNILVIFNIMNVKMLQNDEKTYKHMHMRALCDRMCEFYYKIVKCMAFASNNCELPYYSKLKTVNLPGVPVYLYRPR